MYEQEGITSFVQSLPVQVLGSGQLFHDAELALARDVAHWQNAEAWKLDGARSAIGWLTWKLALSYSRACRLLQLAQALLCEPLIAAALDNHRLSIDQVESIISVGTPERDYEYHRDLEVMIKEAGPLTVAQVRVMTKHWADLADQKLEATKEKPEPHSKLHVAETLHGIVEISGTLRGDHSALMVAALEAPNRPNKSLAIAMSHAYLQSAHPTSSMWAAPNESFHSRCEKPLSFETGTVAAQDAPCQQSIATATTNTIGSTAASPTSTTAYCSADTTTASSTPADGPLPATPTTNSPSLTPPAPTKQHDHPANDTRARRAFAATVSDGYSTCKNSADCGA